MLGNPNPSPKSKIQTPKSKIQTTPFGAAAKGTKTKLIQNPKSKIQTPNGPGRLDFGVWSLDFGFGRAGTGGDGYVANEGVWPCWPPEFGLVGGTQACNRKVASSIPPRTAQIGHRFPAEGFCWKSSPGFRPRVVEIGAQFPEKLRARRRCSTPSRCADHVCKCKGCQPHVASTMCANARDVNIA